VAAGPDPKDPYFQALKEAEQEPEYSHEIVAKARQLDRAERQKRVTAAFNRAMVEAKKPPKYSHEMEELVEKAERERSLRISQAQDQEE
jgi:hypothetical protein